MAMIQKTQLALQDLRYDPGYWEGRVRYLSCSCRTRPTTGANRQVYETLADGESATGGNVTIVRKLLHKSTLDDVDSRRGLAINKRHVIHRLTTDFTRKQTSVTDLVPSGTAICTRYI